MRSAFLLFFAFFIIKPELSYADSLFNTQNKWQNQNGVAVKLSEFLGKPSIITMSYTNCKKTCPSLTMGNLKELQKRLDQKKINANIVVFTLDPKVDTTEVLARYKNKIAPNFDNWSFLTTENEQNTKAISKYLDLADYWRVDDHILHKFVITVFDAKGDVVGRIDRDSDDKNLDQIISTLSVAM